MALFVVQHHSSRSPAQAWARLTDWPSHARFVPLTTIEVTTPPPNGAGTVFLARTGLGRAGFDDPMTVVEWTPPADGAAGHCRLVKGGTLMLGWAELTVAPEGTGSLATWREDITVAHTPKFGAGVTALTSRLLFGRVLRKLVGA